MRNNLKNYFSLGIKQLNAKTATDPQRSILLILPSLSWIKAGNSASGAIAFCLIRRVKEPESRELTRKSIIRVRNVPPVMGRISHRSPNRRKL